jgi:hypothetical protein
MKNHEQSKKSGFYLGKSWNIWDFLGNLWILNWKIMTHLGECWSNHPQVAVEGHTFTHGTRMVVPHSCLSWWLISLSSCFRVITQISRINPYQKPVWTNLLQILRMNHQVSLFYDKYNLGYILISLLSLVIFHYIISYPRCILMIET